MALHYVARSVGVPALRRAWAPRMSSPSSAASGPLASRSYHYHRQAGYNNGDAGRWKQQTLQDIRERAAKHKAEFDATFDAMIMHEKRMKKIERWMYMGSFAIAVGLAWYTFPFIDREVRLLIRERDLGREVMKLMEELKNMDEADMEGHKRED